MEILSSGFSKSRPRTSSGTVSDLKIPGVFGDAVVDTWAEGGISGRTQSWSRAHGDSGTTFGFVLQHCSHISTRFNAILGLDHGAEESQREGSSALVWRVEDALR